jgi:hypothetical protein
VKDDQDTTDHALDLFDDGANRDHLEGSRVKSIAIEECKVRNTV